MHSKWISGLSLVLSISWHHQVSAHSWIERLRVIDPTGRFIGAPGYIRGFVPRNATGFVDTDMTHLLPVPDAPIGTATRSGGDHQDTVGIRSTDELCRDSQANAKQNPGYPRLKAKPGSLIALQYEENGHVTLPQNSKGKPDNRGTVRIYGTSQPRLDGEKFLDVFGQWTANGTGTGNGGRGRLLATQPYDDGRCYQVNSGTISQERQKQFPQKGSGNQDVLCQNDIRLPADIPIGSSYTIYWIWDWPTAAGIDPSLPNGKAEIYTSCMDIDIVAETKDDSVSSQISRRLRGRQKPETSLDYNNLAIPSYLVSLASSATASSLSQTSPIMSATASEHQETTTPLIKTHRSNSTTTSSLTPLQPGSSAIDLAGAEAAILSMLGQQYLDVLANATITASSDIAGGSMTRVESAVTSSPGTTMISPSMTSAFASPTKTTTILVVQTILA